MVNPWARGPAEMTAWCYYFKVGGGQRWTAPTPVYYYDSIAVLRRSVSLHCEVGTSANYDPYLFEYLAKLGACVKGSGSQLQDRNKTNPK